MLSLSLSSYLFLKPSRHGLRIFGRIVSSKESKASSTRSIESNVIYAYIIIYHISNYIEETRNWNEKEEGSVEIFPSPVCLRVSGLGGTRETIPMDN